MAKFRDLTSLKFNRLTAKKVAYNKGGRYYWEFICDCGNSCTKIGSRVVNGDIKSCGCLNVESYTKRLVKHGKHTTLEYKKFVSFCARGLHESNKVDNFLTFLNIVGDIPDSSYFISKINSDLDYSIDNLCWKKKVFKKCQSGYSNWMSMKQRCLNKNNKEYCNYGGAGITICDSFLDYDTFKNDIGEYPKDGCKYTIDRMDNSKGYIVGNVRWATDTEQARNKSMYSNNTTGFTGVHLLDRKTHPVWIAHWYDTNGNQLSKTFNSKDFGIMEAYAMACSYREKVIAELNKAGAGYSNKHGK